MKDIKKKNDIKISIIMTVKNGEEYLKECLDSILKQTLNEIEIVAIYGESKDKTLEILKDYKSKDNRINIYEVEKPGVGLAKNVGIEKSKGEFITFLDADDYYLDADALEKMYTAAKEQNVKVCGAFRSSLLSDGKIEPQKLHRAFLVGFPKGRMFKYSEVQYDYHFHSYIYDREMIVDSDARFAELMAYDDTHFFIRAMLKCINFFVVPVELYCYRCHDPYSWKNSICYEVIQSLTDELKITKENDLKIGHYIAMQRINFEYGPLFEKYIREGDLKLLELMLVAQKEVSNDIIEEMCNKKIDSNIISSMNVPNFKIKFMDKMGEKNYIFTPIYNILTNGEYVNYKDEYENIYNSTTFRIGKKIVWLPKKVLHALHLRK
jgi:glycosyltransferase involved in cell wall biosynthesis